MSTLASSTIPDRAPVDPTGPWTAQGVQVLISLGAKPLTGRSYPVWEWEFTDPAFNLHVLGYQEPNDGRWVFVLELSGPPPEGEKFGWLLINTTTLRDDEPALFEEAARMLNYGVRQSLPSNASTPGVEK